MHPCPNLKINKDYPKMFIWVFIKILGVRPKKSLYMNFSKPQPKIKNMFVKILFGGGEKYLPLIVLGLGIA